MLINTQAIYSLIGMRFRGNVSAFSRALGLNYSTVWRVLTRKTNGLGKFVPSLSAYCKTNGLCLSDYVEI